MASDARRHELNWHDRTPTVLRARRENRARRILRGAAFLLVAAVSVLPAFAGALTDGANRVVDVPADIKAVVPAGPPAQVLLHALAPDFLAGLVEPFKPEDAIYVDPKIAVLPHIPMLSRSKSAEDLAVVAALKPGLCVDYGSLSPRYVDATEGIQTNLNVPAVIFSGDLGDTKATVDALGKALRVDARAAIVSTAVQGVMERVKPVADLPDALRVSVYIARGTDGLLALRAGSAFDQPIRAAGGRNVVAGSGPSMKHLSVAEVVALKPSVVIFAESEAMSSPLHDALSKDTVFILDAGEPYKVLTGPPSINRAVGLLALAPLIHPDNVKVDQDEIKRLETTLFPIPPGLAVPAPLQVRR